VTSGATDQSGPQRKPIVGLDFDNTIVDYDAAFHLAAVERRLIPQTVRPTKQAVRDWLRAAGREEAWTELQGYVYGARMDAAAVFPGVEAFYARAGSVGATILVISHKTRFPYAGPRYDLHAAARRWLADHVFGGGDGAGTGAGTGTGKVFFEPTKEAKLERIASERCDWFVDDLPEFLAEPAFPSRVERVLFDPHNAAVDDARWHRATSWNEMARLVLPNSGCSAGPG
jgi:hypothetical protein